MIIEVQDQLRHYSLENGEAYAVALTAKDTVETARVIHHLSPTNTAAVGRLMMGALLTASDIKAENGDVTCAIDGGGPAGKVLAVASPRVRCALPLRTRRRICRSAKRTESWMYPVFWGMRAV